MTALKVCAAGLCLAALAACSNEPADQPTGDATSPVPPPSATETVAASHKAGEEDQLLPSPAPAAQSIPAALHGRWGLVPADCTSTRGDAKGLLTIDATTLKFYESRATLGAIEESSDTRILAAFAFTGEGMTWQREVVLDALDGGRMLIRREYGEDAAPGPFRYARCAG